MKPVTSHFNHPDFIFCVFVKVQLYNVSEKCNIENCLVPTYIVCMYVHVVDKINGCYVRLCQVSTFYHQAQFAHFVHEFFSTVLPWEFIYVKRFENETWW